MEYCYKIAIVIKKKKIGRRTRVTHLVSLRDDDASPMSSYRCLLRPT